LSPLEEKNSNRSNDNLLRYFLNKKNNFQLLQDFELLEKSKSKYCK
jgi:hypothetical protein